MKRVRVLVNGYGVIGKRVADLASDYRIRMAQDKGLPVFTSDSKVRRVMEEIASVCHAFK
jgi:glyceraldehyde-3-phosphate dehydrogenase/erythrose-4-phosphate dehydrogenase